ncbi:excalibur calcium-binding domain-containing protein [Microvirga arabica]|uniref:excalibur calcium-binding domain-containing protein n=1 Tax=Microvirga arabica TaxID=1128671 RepID=UPI0035E4332A
MEKSASTPSPRSGCGAAPARSPIETVPPPVRQERLLSIGGQPGYASHLDGDNDGIACEPYPRW